jgi:hypothetical protein
MKNFIALLILEGAFAISISEIKGKSKIASTDDTKLISDSTFPWISAWANPLITQNSASLNSSAIDNKVVLVSYIGFEYEGEGVGEMFGSFSDKEMREIKDSLAVLIYHKWNQN